MSITDPIEAAEQDLRIFLFGARAVDVAGRWADSQAVQIYSDVPLEPTATPAPSPTEPPTATPPPPPADEPLPMGAEEESWVRVAGRVEVFLGGRAVDRSSSAEGKS
jgi:hypothetical protein